MASQSRKARGMRTQRVLAEWFQRHGWGTAPERLAAKLTVASSGCWEWGGAVSSTGYGNIFVGSKRLGTARTERAHRLAWLLTNDDIPAGLDVCHRCDNRVCCNPEHLFLGTHKENMDDMTRKGRRVNTPHPGESNGRAVLTEDEVRFIRVSLERGVDLAARFGVEKSTITAIRKGRLWKSVA